MMVIGTNNSSFSSKTDYILNFSIWTVIVMMMMLMVIMMMMMVRVM